MKASPTVTISAAKFKATCLELMDRVAATGETITVTKRGKPVAVLTAARPRKNKLRGSWKGRIKILGDIVAPIDVVWNAAR